MHAAGPRRRGKKSLSPVIRAQRINGSFSLDRRFISIKLWAIAANKINWKANDIVSARIGSFSFSLFFRKPPISRASYSFFAALIERINNSTHYRFSHSFAQAWHRLMLLSRWKFMHSSFRVHAESGDNFAKFKKCWCSISFFVFGEASKTKTRPERTRAEISLMCVKNILPLPCEGRFSKAQPSERMCID